MDNRNEQNGGKRPRSRQAKINTAIAIGVAVLIVAAFSLLVFFGVKAIVSATRRGTESESESASNAVADVSETENQTEVQTDTSASTAGGDHTDPPEVLDNYQNYTYDKSQNVGKLILVNDGHPVFTDEAGETMFNAESETLQDIYDSSTKKLVQLYNAGLQIRGREMKKQLTAMLTALNEGLADYLTENKLNMFIGTANRTYAVQEGLSNYDTAYSKPGYSDYNTGYAFSFAVREEGVTYSVDNYPTIADWILDHAAEYGFIIRYPDGKALITGVSDEPWHMRYVGVPHAGYMSENNLCLEEYISLLHRYTPDKGVLTYSAGGASYRIYYVAAESGYGNDIPIPNGVNPNRDCEISGTNDGGFIVTVKD